ncbi:hypothetical protein [Peristeroidobacter soli]|uniref:hypothetical protein n=1 Tax=Peristeroidobacter soli TaxID=2497877 RepID=UPI00101DF838|nr:hypothetical protein [Peristeroidobacter soli]
MNDSANNESPSGDRGSSIRAGQMLHLRELSAQLRETGLVRLKALYEMVDGRAIVGIVCLDANDQPVLPRCPMGTLAEALKTFETLLNERVRELGGGAVDGAGEFDWDVVDNNVIHKHVITYNNFD